MSNPDRPVMPIQYPIVVSHSELESASRCPFQHQLSYRERWTRPRDETTPAGRGVIWHSVLQAHYQTLKDAQTAARLRTGDWRAFDAEAALAQALEAVTVVLEGVADTETQSLLSWMYDGYVDWHGPDLEWEILEVELRGEVPLDPPVARKFRHLDADEPYGWVDASELFVFKFFADLVVRDSGRVWIVDHKSVHDFPSNLDLDLDSQFDRYTWAMRKLGYDVFGQQYNMARRRKLKVKAQPLSERHRREITYRSPAELDRVAQDMFLTAYDRYSQALELEALGVDSPRVTSSRHCSRVCDFTEPCLADRKGVPLNGYLEALGYRQDPTRH